MINTLRHFEVFNHSKYANSKILIVGAGAIGSRVFENLASLGMTNIRLVDFDIVEPHNLANQLYGLVDVGHPKVESAKRWCIAKCGQDTADTIEFLNDKLGPDSRELMSDVDIVISCVDTFEARRMLLTLAAGEMVDIFIDTRMASSSVEVYACTPSNYSSLKNYEDTIGDDDDPSYETSSCGSSLSVGSTAQLAGSVGAWSVMSWLKNNYMEPKLRVTATPFEAHTDW